MYLRDKKENMREILLFSRKAEKPQWILIMLLFSWGLPSLHRWILDVPFLEGGFFVAQIDFFPFFPPDKTNWRKPSYSLGNSQTPCRPSLTGSTGSSPSWLRTSLSTETSIWWWIWSIITRYDYLGHVILPRLIILNIEGTVIISLSLSRSRDSVSCCVIVFNIEICLPLSRIRKSTLKAVQENCFSISEILWFYISTSETLLEFGKWFHFCHFKKYFNNVLLSFVAFQ